MGEVVQFPVKQQEPPKPPAPKLLGGGQFVSLLPHVCSDLLCSNPATHVLRLEYETGEKGAKFYCAEHYPVLLG